MNGKRLSTEISLNRETYSSINLIKDKPYCKTFVFGLSYAEAEIYILKYISCILMSATLNRQANITNWFIRIVIENEPTVVH